MNSDWDISKPGMDPDSIALIVDDNAGLGFGVASPILGSWAFWFATHCLTIFASHYSGLHRNGCRRSEKMQEAWHWLQFTLSVNGECECQQLIFTKHDHWWTKAGFMSCVYITNFCHFLSKMCRIRYSHFSLVHRPTLGFILDSKL